MEETEIKKRPLMAKISNNYCNKIYITDDNPRNEDLKIRKELLRHISHKKTQCRKSNTSYL